MNCWTEPDPEALLVSWALLDWSNGEFVRRDGPGVVLTVLELEPVDPARLPARLCNRAGMVTFLCPLPLSRSILHLKTI